MQTRERGNRPGGRSFGRMSGKRRFDDRDGGSKQMFQATCADCGDVCSVPFKPRGDRPIYCSNCFGKHNQRDDRRSGGTSDQSRFAERRMFSATCDNCGTSCEVPFRPTGEKPVYCKECFAGMGRGTGTVRRDSQIRSDRGSDQTVLTELRALSAKMDTLISALVPSAVPKIHVIKAAKAEIPKPKKQLKKAAKKKAAKKK